MSVLTWLPWLVAAVGALGIGWLAAGLFHAGKKDGIEDAEAARLRAVQQQQEKANEVERRVARTDDPLAELRRDWARGR
jgi:hypothetical protein